MTGRMLVITRAALIETLRARLTPAAGLTLLLAVPVLAWLLGDDAGTRAWLSRGIATEGLRVVLPLAVTLGGGFLLKPSLKRGWTILPARRAEYFAGTALAGCVIVLAGAVVFTAGGLFAAAAFGEDLTVTRHATEVSKQRGAGAAREVTAPTQATVWAEPERGEELVLGLPDGVSGDVRGTLEYQLVWTAEAAPRNRSPVALWVQDAAGRRALETVVQSRHRVAFSGECQPDAVLIVQPTDPVLIVGTSPPRARFETDRAGALGSLLCLLVLSVGACVLCLLLVLMVRSLATGPTAVLAGMLLLAGLTLLPSLEPAGRMARDRRADTSGEPSLAQRVEFSTSKLPELLPAAHFEEYLAARVVSADAWADAGWRLLAGVALLAPGVWLFRLRQIAK